MKQTVKTIRKGGFLTLVMGGLMVASLTACSTADEVADNKGNETAGLKFIIDGTLPTDNSKTRSGSLVDNNTHTGGMDFKWLASTDKMTAWAYLPNDGTFLTAYWGENDQTQIEYCTLAVTPDGSNPRRARLESSSYINGNMGAVNGTFYCIQNASNLTSDNGGVTVTADLIMPENNVFTQTGQNSSDHLTDYLFIKGKSDFTTSTIGTAQVQNIDVQFHTSVATIRLKVTNRQGAAVAIKNVTIKSTDKMFPDHKIWNTTGGCQNIADLTETITEPTDQSGYTSSITAQCGTNGFEVAKDAVLYNYVAVHQHDAANALAGKKLDFVITTVDGNTYTAYNFDCDKLSQITGNNDFVTNYTYTFSLSLKENKLTLGGVTVDKWDDEVDGGEANGNTVMSLTNWCSTETYQTQREALTTLTLNGETITETERLNYMAAASDGSYNHFAEYFPKVTTVNFTGTTMNVTSVLAYNNTVTDIIGKDLVTLDNTSFEHMYAVTSYDLPNLESMPKLCFSNNSSLVEISLPKLKKMNVENAFRNDVKLTRVCFASLSDFTDAAGIFTQSPNITDLALGTTEVMTKSSNREMNSILGGSMYANVNSINVILYLNENGYEYKNNADLTTKTWRGITFKDIKKYWEYPGRKN